MKQWTINWISTRKAMPNKSGNYLTLKNFQIYPLLLAPCRLAKNIMRLIATIVSHLLML